MDLRVPRVQGVQPAPLPPPHLSACAREKKSCHARGGVSGNDCTLCTPRTPRGFP